MFCFSLQSIARFELNINTNAPFFNTHRLEAARYCVSNLSTPSPPPPQPLHMYSYNVVHSMGKWISLDIFCYITTLFINKSLLIKTELRPVKNSSLRFSLFKTLIEIPILMLSPLHVCCLLSGKSFGSASLIVCMWLNGVKKYSFNIFCVETYLPNSTFVSETLTVS